MPASSSLCPPSPTPFLKLTLLGLMVTTALPIGFSLGEVQTVLGRAGSEVWVGLKLGCKVVERGPPQEC